MVKIHPTADVQSQSIGNNSVIWQFVIILPGAVIGKNCNINAYCFLENDVIVGNNVTLKCGVYLWDGIVLEDNVQIGPNVAFTNDLYPRAKQAFNVSKTFIRHGASIGANATLIGGITIGKYALIGAGSVVTKNVPDNTLWYGNPARHVAYVCNCGYKLDDSLICKKCNLQYRIENLQLAKK
jgi:UDP-2-acetamido-3-amino-2,3-dideoxy-glucuronate N-acetyltransferase